jgi:hypothetical protein
MRLGRFGFFGELGAKSKLCPVCDHGIERGWEFGFQPCWWGWSLGFTVKWVCHHCLADGHRLNFGVAYNNAKGMRWQEEVLDPVRTRKPTTKPKEA